MNEVEIVVFDISTVAIYIIILLPQPYFTDNNKKKHKNHIMLYYR